MKQLYSVAYNTLSITILALLLFGQPLVLKAQDNPTECPETENKKAQDLYKKANDMQKYKKEERMAFLKQALDLDEDYLAANFMYAEELIKTEVYENSAFAPACVYFKKVIDLCPKYHSDPYYFMGFSYYEQEKYGDAIIWLQKFLDFKDDNDKKYSKKYDDYLYEAREMIKYAKFYKDIMEHPVPFDPYPVAGLCTSHDEYLPCISPDNQFAFFTRKLPFSNMNQSFGSEDNIKEFFMTSERGKDGNFTEGTKMPSPPFNMGTNEGGPSITIDNQHLYFTICKQEGGQEANCDIYYCDWVNGGWGEITNMGPQVNDPDAWDSQPSVSADGNTLYFASDRKGGYGKVDIWTTTKDPNSGQWTTAVNLGPTINTAGNDKTPFIHSDSHTLYFSSDGRYGLGGYDIFYSRANDSGKWGEPKNIGTPINGTGDDLGFFVSTDGKTGYFCSNDPNKTKGRGAGGWDIYQFTLYEAARPAAMDVADFSTKDPDGNPIPGASYTAIDATTKQKLSIVHDSNTGTGRVVVKKGSKAILTVNKKGFAFGNVVIQSKDTGANSKPVAVNLETKEIKEGANYNLSNIYYKTNSAELEPISIEVIQQFSTFLKENATIKIKIVGYTDNVGKDADNLALSKDRAFTVMQTLQQNGIDPARLSFEGMGAANPVAGNDTEEGRQKNRRTEFIITQK